jgi:hypothetical protein
MATFRKIHTTFWTDPFVEDLTQEQKLFYLYLITNTKTKQSGIYEISKRYIAYETGFSVKEVNDLLLFFEEKGKIEYSAETNEIMICNWNKFNYNSSYQSIICIHDDLKEVKNINLVRKMYNEEYINQLQADVLTKDDKNKSKYTPFMEYLCSIHTRSMDNKQQDQEQAQDQEQVEVEVQQQVELQDQVQEQEVEKSFITDDTNTNEPSLGGDGSGSIESSDELLEVVKNALNK